MSIIPYSHVQENPWDVQAELNEVTKGQFSAIKTSYIYQPLFYQVLRISAIFLGSGNMLYLPPLAAISLSWVTAHTALKATAFPTGVML